MELRVLGGSHDGDSIKVPDDFHRPFFRIPAKDSIQPTFQPDSADINQTTPIETYLIDRADECLIFFHSDGGPR